MKMLLGVQNKRLFPCPICGKGLEVRESKKSKPYVVCDGCGVQLFVRNNTGIRTFEKLITDAASRNIWARLAELEQHYKKKCPNCGKEFWVKEELMVTSWFDGKFSGYRCPEPECQGIVEPEDKK